MVEELEGSGLYARDVMQEHGLNINYFRQININGSNAQRARQATLLLSEIVKFPEHDSNSYFVRNTSSPTHRMLDVLYVPKECPRLPEVIDRPDGFLMPKAGETFVVELHNNNSNEDRTQLILADDKYIAERIAVRNVSEAEGWFRIETQARVKSVTPQEFIQEAKARLDGGYRLPPFVMRFADLEKYRENILRRRYR